MRGIYRNIIAVGVLVAMASLAMAAETGTQATTRPTTLPAGFRGITDEGSFVLYLNEEKLVTMNGKLAGGNYQADAVLSMAGQTANWRMKVSADDSGGWKQINAYTPQGEVTVERKGNAYTQTVRGKVSTFELKGEPVLFGNFDPLLMSWAVLRYDRERGGPQTCPMYIVGGGIFNSSIELKDSVQRSVGTRDMRFDRFIFHLPGVDMTVWADVDGRVYLGEVPAQHAAYVRQGYEILRKSEQEDPKLSRPIFDVVVQRNVGAPMRDGVKLATDLYLPSGQEKSPLILIRTPYKKGVMEIQAKYYARRGFAVAVQDCRGRFDSPGTWEPFVNEPTDGYDAIEWLAGQTWCTGKVGMIGGSYVGWVQWWAASQRPPHLATIIPNVAPPDPFFNIPYEYGAFFMWGSIWWADVLESNATADISGVAFAKVMDKKYGTLLKALPVIDLDKAVLGKENVYWRRWIEHPTNDGYWRPANFSQKLKDVEIPVFHQSGWFDGDGIGTKLNYAAMRAAGHKNQKLVLGPWGHTDQAMRALGTRDFGDAAIIDLQRAYLRWMDRWLKGIDNGIDREPLVDIFVINEKKWLHGDAYPLPQTQFQKWYLSSGGHASSSKGDGKLSDQLPAESAPADHYIYDPADPTPAPYFSLEDESATTQPTTRAATRPTTALADADHGAGGYYAKVGERADVLVYVSEPMQKPLTFAGPVSAVIYAASSAKDTDWFVRLAEVDEKGEIFHLVEGRLRARFRESMSQPTLMKPGEVYEFKLDLWQTGIRIEKGRRLRVEVASASFPVFSRNLNTGGHNETETTFVKAEQTIYHDAKRPSHVLLPVIPE